MTNLDDHHMQSPDDRDEAFGSSGSGSDGSASGDDSFDQSFDGGRGRGGRGDPGGGGSGSGDEGMSENEDLDELDVEESNMNVGEAPPSPEPDLMHARTTSQSAANKKPSPSNPSPGFMQLSGETNGKNGIETENATASGSGTKRRSGRNGGGPGELVRNDGQGSEIKDGRSHKGKGGRRGGGGGEGNKQGGQGSGSGNNNASGGGGGGGEGMGFGKADKDKIQLLDEEMVARWDREIGDIFFAAPNHVSRASTSAGPGLGSGVAPANTGASKKSNDAAPVGQTPTIAPQSCKGTTDALINEPEGVSASASRSTPATSPSDAPPSYITEPPKVEDSISNESDEPAQVSAGVDTPTAATTENGSPTNAETGMIVES